MLRGIIEGFYGPPWSWELRAEVASWCAARGMGDYVYAPKDDPKHRERWADPYDPAELDAFAQLAGLDGVRLGFAISPGLSIDADAADDRARLAAKVDQVVAVGATNVVLALDDIPFGGGPQGESHARLATWLRDHLGDRAGLALIPTEYVGLRSSPHLEALAEGVPDDVPIGWTGRAVVNDAITVAEAHARAEALGGRPPLLWDNYPVNDAVMRTELFVGPVRGRDADLPGALSGYLANPMVEGRASTLPLASIAGWLEGDDPEAVWRTTAADLGWLAFAAACDGEEARAAVRAAAEGHLFAARTVFTEAAVCAAPGLEDEAGPWLEQVHRDAALALEAIAVLDGERDVGKVLRLASGWQASIRAKVSVFGPRCSVRPMLSQADDGTWRVDRASVRDGENAVDDLVRLALDTLE
jgi:hypothetical protein